MTGFDSKRDMAADKLQEDQVKYGTSWSKDGERIDPMSVYKEQPAQEPVSFPCCGYTDANAIRWNQFNGVVQCHMCGQVYTVAQPAQEPTGMLHIERLDKWLDASLKERKQREWVGLTDADFCREINTDDFLAGAFFAEAKLKERNHGT